MAQTDDERIKLCVIGSFNDTRFREEITRVDRGRVQLIDYRPVADVPRLTSLADLVCLPQNPIAEFVAHQTPMKLTEALAMGIPVLARVTPALMPFVDRGLVATIGDAPLSERIVELLADHRARAQMALRGREFFLEHLSYTTGLATVGSVIATFRPLTRRCQRAGNAPASSPARRRQRSRRGPSRRRTRDR